MAVKDVISRGIGNESGIPYFLTGGFGIFSLFEILSTASDYGLLDLEDGFVSIEKTPDEAITIEFPWAEQLDGETISSASYELPDGLTNEADSETGTVSKVRVSGGSGGRIYRVISKVTTSASQDFEWVKRVRVAEG